VSGWQGRPWAQHAERMRETIECLRPILAGARVDYTGQVVTVEWLLHKRISRSEVVEVCMRVLDAAVGAHLGFAAPTE
jgi:hypothetical protein